MILKDGVPGVRVPKLTSFGIRPAGIATGGDQPSPLANDVQAGDTLTQLLWVLLPPLVATGTTRATDAGGYALDEPGAGVHVQPARLLAVPQTGDVRVSEAPIVTIVGELTYSDPRVTLYVTPRAARLGASFVGA